MKDTGSMYRIARIDNNRTEGWKVTLPGPVGGKATIYKTFTDICYQGRNQALMAAQKFRDGLITRRKSASGRYGVSLLRVHSVTGAISSITWVVRVPVGGRSKRKSFNLRDYSYEEAWRLAMEERVKHGGLPSPKDPPPMPEWVREWLSHPINPKKPRKPRKPRVGNISGHAGVRLKWTCRHGKIRSVNWEASISADGQKKKRSWAVLKHGYAGAWRLAEECRAGYDGSASPTEPPPMPEWLKEQLLAQKKHG